MLHVTKDWLIFVRRRKLPCAGLFALALLGSVTVMAAQPDEDHQIADSLAAMLRAGRAVISSNQQRINDQLRDRTLHVR